MFRYKVATLSLFAVLAICAVASASASADSCTGGARWVFCTSPGNQPLHNSAVVGTGGLSVLASKVGAMEVRLHCPDATVSGTLKLLGLAVIEVSSLGCSVERPANCTVASLILSVVHIQALSATTGLETGNKPGGSKEFTSVTLGGASCAVAGAYAITGEQEVTFPEGGAAKVEHEIVAKKSGSKLKFGAEPASLNLTATVHLVNNEDWLIMAGE